MRPDALVPSIREAYAASRTATGPPAELGVNPQTVVT